MATRSLGRRRRKKLIPATGRPMFGKMGAYILADHNSGEKRLATRQGIGNNGSTSLVVCLWGVLGICPRVSQPRQHLWKHRYRQILPDNVVTTNTTIRRGKETVDFSRYLG
ncbi:hypothetical protein BD311DRAFT_760653 [Dichomitus squalens]|uniref:Uncharacterized protein n=1 Tax=Dichomitus squalens TaxID=114155 RepID=A0A4Q9MIN6_9APHY|nr:hypothetical protein BD311DRAFT_760653 [Dichomitus squalens]